MEQLQDDKGNFLPSISGVPCLIRLSTFIGVLASKKTVINGKLCSVSYEEHDDIQTWEFIYNRAYHRAPHSLPMHRRVMATFSAL